MSAGRRPRPTTTVPQMIVMETFEPGRGFALHWYSDPAAARAGRPLMSADRLAFATHQPGWEAKTLRPIVEQVHTLIRDWTRVTQAFLTDPSHSGETPPDRPWTALITHRRGLWGHLHPMADVIGATAESQPQEQPA